MEEYRADEVARCYDLAAQAYAATFLNELADKPFDRNILDRFAAMLPAGGALYDFGCGSGQTTVYLHALNRQRVIGLDFSPQTVALAAQTFPEIAFGIDNMLHSKMPSASADGIVAFYAIVHFTEKEVEICLQEWKRLLKPGGKCLFSFHHGDEVVAITDFLGVPGANATWRFFDTDRVLALAEKTGFTIYEAVLRYPYKDVEHPSKRAYIILEA